MGQVSFASVENLAYFNSPNGVIGVSAGSFVSSQYVSYFGLSPAYYLNFINSGALDPSLTFTRATSATYYNSSGVLATASSGAARFDYNPQTLVSLGLLVEESRVNSCLQSGDLSNAAWNVTAVTKAANQGVSPDGTTNAASITEDGTTNNHRLTQGAITLTAGQPVSVSVYVKRAVGTRNAQIGVVSGANFVTTTFDLGTGTQNGTNDSLGAIFSNRSATIQNVGNGWYRITVSASTATATVYSFIVGLVSGTSDSYAGDSTSSLYAYGAQTEQGAFQTSYIATTTVAVTRNADSCVNSSIGSFYNTAQGTGVAQFDTAALVATTRVIGTNTATTFAQFQNTTVNLGIYDGNSLATVNSFSTINTTQKVASTYVGTASQICLNAGTVASGALGGAFPFSAVTAIAIGSNAGTSNFLNGHVRSFAYYKTALTSTQLQSITA